MKTKSETVTVTKNSNSKILKLRAEFLSVKMKELSDYNEAILQKIKKRCWVKGEYDSEKVKELVLEVYEGLKYEESQTNLLNLLKNKDRTVENLIMELIKIISSETFEYSTFSSTMPDFFKIIDTDEQLNAFLSNPQKYINDNNRKLSSFELQVLEIVINDPAFSQLPSINRQHNPSVFISSPLTTQLWQLNISQYGSLDAARFDQCIEPSAREFVLAKSRQNIKGPPVIGLAGALVSYDRSSIAKTAEMVKHMGMGACHTFAQLAADHLLVAIEKGLLPPAHIKMVSHQNDLGSHTYLLLDHNSDDLTDLSQCTIVDLWAVVMGYTKQGYGAFLMSNYPYPDMTTNLVCCYDSQQVNVNKSEETATSSLSFIQQLAKASSTKGNFFSTSHTNQNEKLNRKQQVAVTFLDYAKEFIKTTSKNHLKLDLIDLLTTQVKQNEITPEIAMKVATQSMFARSIERNTNNFLWKGVVFNKSEQSLSSLLPAFDKSIGFWTSYLKKHGVMSSNETLNTIDVDFLKKIVDFLDGNEEHSFSADSQKTYKI
ncbi:hypothetical protein [Legionella sp. WA2024007413]